MNKWIDGQVNRQMEKWNGGHVDKQQTDRLTYRNRDELEVGQCGHTDIGTDVERNVKLARQIKGKTKQAKDRKDRKDKKGIFF